MSDRRPHVVIAGSGIAGLTAALHAARHAGVRITLVTKDVLEHTNTRAAQGGIAGVMFADDRAEDHHHDTMVAGAWQNDPEAVQLLVSEGPKRIRELIALGVAFDRGAGGELTQGLEAAHSYPRILHAGGDATGAAIEAALAAELRRQDVEVLEHAFLVDLVLHDGRVAGVELLLGDDATHVLEADAVVLATGGFGQLYAHSTNAVVATGDGLAVALRAGARVADLEFVQFHPTVLEAGAAGGAFPVSEAVRGEGATLVDDTGHRFAFDHHPDGELAPRDVLARAIASRMVAQGGPVRLDATALGGAFLATRFPTIDAAVRERGLDWAREPIPVTPAAHYAMGGVVTDLDGHTSIPGLFAVGEVARTGVHGANRLASNSLLEGAVFGARAGEAVAREVLGGAPLAAGDAGPRRILRREAEAPQLHLAPAKSPCFDRATLQHLMWELAGLTRDEAGLRHAAAQLTDWQAALPAPRTVREHEDANLLLIGSALAAAALRRTDSIGAHYRSDSKHAGPAPADPRTAPAAPATNATPNAPAIPSTRADLEPAR